MVPAERDYNVSACPHGYPPELICPHCGPLLAKAVAAAEHAVLAAENVVAACESETNYANAPIAIAEVRAQKADDSSQWSPRECLIKVLRDIDSGTVNPECLIIAYRYQTPDGTLCVGHTTSTQDSHQLIGLLSGTLFAYQMEAFQFEENSE